MDDPKLPVDYFKDLEIEETGIAEGIIVETDPEPDVANLVFKYGNQKLFKLDLMEFLKHKPSIGHARDLLYFPEEQRIDFTHPRHTHIVKSPRDMGRYSFCHARCLRGVGENAEKCYIDLLKVSVTQVPRNILNKVPEGVAFVGKISYNINKEENDGESAYTICFKLKEFVDFSMEDIPFAKCPWELRNVTDYLPEQLPFDYTRKFEPSAKDEHFAIYIGNDLFISMKYGREYVFKHTSLGHILLDVSRVYRIVVVPTRVKTTVSFYAISVFFVSKKNFKEKMLDAGKVFDELERAAINEFEGEQVNNMALLK